MRGVRRDLGQQTVRHLGPVRAGHRAGYLHMPVGWHAEGSALQRAAAPRPLPRPARTPPPFVGSSAWTPIISRLKGELGRPVRILKVMGLRREEGADRKKRSGQCCADCTSWSRTAGSEKGAGQGR